MVFSPLIDLLCPRIFLRRIATILFYYKVSAIFICSHHISVIFSAITQADIRAGYVYHLYKLVSRRNRAQSVGVGAYLSIVSVNQLPIFPTSAPFFQSRKTA